PPSVVAVDDVVDRHLPRRLPGPRGELEIRGRDGWLPGGGGHRHGAIGAGHRLHLPAGSGDESNLQILLYLAELDITGLMLAGMIIGALGVLKDGRIAHAATI